MDKLSILISSLDWREDNSSATSSARFSIEEEEEENDCGDSEDEGYGYDEGDGVADNGKFDCNEDSGGDDGGVSDNSCLLFAFLLELELELGLDNQLLLIDVDSGILLLDPIIISVDGCNLTASCCFSALFDGAENEGVIADFMPHHHQQSA